jgi:hypothetical protein
MVYDERGNNIISFRRAGIMDMERREREDDGLWCVALLRFLAGLFHVAVIWRQIST